MGKFKSLVAVRAALIGVLALLIGRADASTSSTTVYPMLNIFDTFAAQPFDPIDPSAAGISVDVTGTWTFVFGHDASLMPIPETSTLDQLASASLWRGRMGTTAQPFSMRKSLDSHTSTISRGLRRSS